MSQPGRTRVLLIAAISVALFALVGVPLGVWACRGLIATSMARDTLEERGFECEDAFSVAVSAGLGAATIDPTRCTRATGALESVELTSEADVELSGLSAEHVRLPSLTLNLRAVEVRNGDRWAQALRRFSLEQRVAGFLKSLSELSGFSDGPAIAIDEVVVNRDGSRLATLHGVELSPGSALGIRTERVAFSATSFGTTQLALTQIHGSATDSTVQLSGTAEASTGLIIVGSVRRARPFTVHASGLDSAQPRFSLQGGPW